MGIDYLAVDDVVVDKPFTTHNPWVGWTYSTTQKRKMRGFHVVVLLWCLSIWRIPVAFRLWRPKQSCRPKNYRKKTQLAWEMMVEVYQQGLDVAYVSFDARYTAGWLTKRIDRLGLKWVGVLLSPPSETILHWASEELGSPSATIFQWENEEYSSPSVNFEFRKKIIVI